MKINHYYNLAKKKLFSINRSITGAGVRKTLKIINKEFPKLKIKKIQCGEKVFDWKIPSEWNVSEAYIIDKNKKKIIDFKDNNLHLASYSIPVNKYFDKKELFKHLHALPKQKNAIPYMTYYYKRNWGFCLSYIQKKKFDAKYRRNDKFKVVIKSNFNTRGFLNYGELVIQGKSKKEILISTYICHPSMANNELSGPIVAMCLANYFSKHEKIDKTLRFLFIPETIGSIAYINKNLVNLKKRVIGGYLLSCIGDDKQHSCMLTKYSDTSSDRSLIEAYKKLKINYKIYSFLKRGSDERQYNSPGVDLPIASIFRTKYGMYPEYHTSLDNFKLVTKKGIEGGFNVSKLAIKILNKKINPKNKILCEPKMSKRNLYSTSFEKKYSTNTYFKENNPSQFMNFLQYSDGKNDLESISLLIGLKLNIVKKIYNILKKHNLII